jgi:ATP-dependent DNA helicase RecG
MIEGIKKLGPQGLEPVTYPPETLHEIVTNARCCTAIAA